MRDGVFTVHNSQVILVLYGNVGISPASSSSFELISSGTVVTPNLLRDRLPAVRYRNFL